MRSSPVCVCSYLCWLYERTGRDPVLYFLESYTSLMNEYRAVINEIGRWLEGTSWPNLTIFRVSYITARSGSPRIDSKELSCWNNIRISYLGSPEDRQPFEVGIYAVSVPRLTHVNQACVCFLLTSYRPALTVRDSHAMDRVL